MEGYTTQAASAVMMMRPVHFCYNAETAVDNAFQNKNNTVSERTIQERARKEFDEYVKTLRGKGIEVVDFEDTMEPHTPDSIFCNNWISFHADGTIILYPMKAHNRRLERRSDVVEQLASKHNFNIKKEISIINEEENGRFLEGTGSIIFDYVNKIAYACVSQRTDKELLDNICEKLGYRSHTFRSTDRHGKEVYHTNVIMCLGEKFVIISMESITDPIEREDLRHAFMRSGHKIVDLSHHQVESFAANALEVKNDRGKSFLVVSKRGFESLNRDQINIIEESAEIIAVDLDTIETNGGGSARCMIADIRLPKKFDA